MNDTNLPITGICLISKSNNVPTGYHCIRKVFDDQTRDADLMADTIRGHKDRFLCITRAYPLAGNKTLVLEDIKLINERDTVVPPYIALTQTMDTYEKGTAKRMICVKMVERQAGMQCICDIIFLYRSKRPPQFYTIIGDINGLQMCIKEGSVPPLRAPPLNIYPDPMDYQSHHEIDSKDHPHIKKSDEREMLDGIPFEINSKYLIKNRNGTNDSFGLDSFRILSRYELEQIFNYDFNLEKSFFNI